MHDPSCPDPFLNAFSRNIRDPMGASLGVVPSSEAGSQFSEINVALDSNGPGTTGKAYNISGQQLIFMRDGSHPGARLNISGLVNDFAPGQRVIAPFGGFTITRADRSAQAGNARLMVVKSLSVDIREPEDHTYAMFRAKLLGDIDAGTFVQCAQNTQPSGASPQGSFDITGLRRIRVWIDGRDTVNAQNMATVDLIPWYRFSSPTFANTWFEQGENLKSLIDSQSTAYRYRLCTFDMSPGGIGLPAGTGLKMFLEVRNLVGSGGMDYISMAVEGYE